VPVVALALGSNLGDRRAHLNWAVDRLAAHLTDLRLSSILETEPVDVPDPQPPYLNAVVVGKTDLSPDMLMQKLLDLEREQGRTRPALRAPRTLDLDLILYGDLILNTPALTVPHPRFRDRRFVLAPLAELAPDWRDPVTGNSIAALLAALAK
jgi:2-amino-4-hydroxy-6-hydroxymethyldihydropteridine diphosphokinase